jgi:hypothetical protein
LQFLLNKLVVTYQFKKFSAGYSNRLSCFHVHEIHSLVEDEFYLYISILLFKIHSNITLPSALGSLKWSLSFMFLYQIHSSLFLMSHSKSILTALFSKIFKICYSKPHRYLHYHVNSEKLRNLYSKPKANNFMRLGIILYII